MKSFSTIFSSVTALALLFPVSGLSAEIKKAPTAAEITAKRRQVERVYEKSSAQAVDGAVKVERKKASLLAQSDYLVGQRGFTIVPKGSVVGNSPRLTLSESAPLKGKLLSWDEFYRFHRAYIRFLPITEAQWSGEDSVETLRPKVELAQKSGFTTLTTLNKKLVSLKAIQKLLQTPKS